MRNSIWFEWQKLSSQNLCWAMVKAVASEDEKEIQKKNVAPMAHRSVEFIAELTEIETKNIGPHCNELINESRNGYHQIYANWFYILYIFDIGATFWSHKSIVQWQTKQTVLSIMLPLRCQIKQISHHFHSTY